MATVASYVLCDNTTYANYAAWASLISAAFAAGGWRQSNDTGQVMFSGMSLTAVSVSGAQATYTYSARTGLPLAAGRALTITGMQNSANNGVMVIDSFTGTTSGTFTVTNAGVAESGSTGVVTIQATAPGNGVTFYEIWQPNDGLTNFFVKLETGNNGTNQPYVRITVSTLTSGAGVATGQFMGPFSCGLNAGNGGAVPWECRISAGPGRAAGMLWRNSGNTTSFFGIERGVNSSGVYLGNHVTFVGGGSSSSSAHQQSMLLDGSGVCPLQSVLGSGTQRLALRCPSVVSAVFAQQVPFDTVAPFVGFYDYPLLGYGCTTTGSAAEGQVIPVTVYGATHYYFCSSGKNYTAAIPSDNGMLCMRYE